MWLTLNKFLIPKQWMHNYFIKDDDGKTLKDIIQEQCMPLPHRWRSRYTMNIFDQAYYGIIPDIQNHKPSEQNEQGFTVAMLLILNNIKVPLQWRHDPNIQNNYGMTVAMYQAFKGIIPPQYWYHTPTIQNNDGNTIAMILAMNNIDIPKQWEHSPELQNKEGYTVAMFYAENQRIPPEYWQHNPLIINKYYETVATILIDNMILPPKEWEHTIYESNIVYDFKISKFLLDSGYKQLYNRYIPPNYDIIYIQNGMCQICFTDGQQKFIKTKCEHQICYECFKQLIRERNINKCPVCRQENWLQRCFNLQENQNQHNDNHKQYNTYANNIGSKLDNLEQQYTKLINLSKYLYQQVSISRQLQYQIQSEIIQKQQQIIRKQQQISQEQQQIIQELQSVSYNQEDQEIYDEFLLMKKFIEH